MSGNANIFGNSPVSAGSRFASPAVKIGVAIGIGVGTLIAYQLLTGQAHDFFHSAAEAPGQPSPQTAPSTTQFTPMPPPQATDATGRPKASGPDLGGTTGGMNGGFGAQRPTLDLYSAHGGAVGGAAAAAARSEAAAAARDAKAQKSALEAEVTPTKFAATGVTELPDLDYLIEQGRYLPCTQMSFINTTYAGSVTAIIPEVIKGSTGDIELIGAGATVFGTIEHGIVNGVDRVFVLWQQITTPVVRDRLGIPHKFRIEVDSPASDQIGQTGLDGDLNRHLPSKFAAVIGLSLIEGLSQGLPNLLERQGNNNNNFSLSFNQMGSGMQSGGNLLMQQFLNVPDVVTRLQGKGCGISIVRDLDLKDAYPQLRSLLAMQGRTR